MRRNPFSNAADLFVSPLSATPTQRASSDRSYSVYVRFTTATNLPPVAPDVFFPLIDGRRIKLQRAWTVASQREIGVLFETDRLGLDLLLASAHSPAGLQGVASYAGTGFTIPLVAALHTPNYPIAKLYTSYPQSKCRCALRLQSTVEFPVLIQSIHNVAAGTQQIVDKELPAWAKADVTTPIAATTNASASITFRLQPLSTVPYRYDPW